MSKRKHPPAGYEPAPEPRLHSTYDWKRLPFQPDVSPEQGDEGRLYKIVRGEAVYTVKRWGFIPSWYPIEQLIETCISESLRECVPLFQASALLLGTAVLNPLVEKYCHRKTREITRHYIRQTKTDALVQEMDEQGNVEFRPHQIMREQFIREFPAGEDSPTDSVTFDPMDDAAPDSTTEDRILTRIDLQRQLAMLADILGSEDYDFMVDYNSRKGKNVQDRQRYCRLLEKVRADVTKRTPKR